MSGRDRGRHSKNGCKIPLGDLAVNTINSPLDKHGVGLQLVLPHKCVVYFHISRKQTKNRNERDVVS